MPVSSANIRSLHAHTAQHYTDLVVNALNSVA